MISIAEKIDAASKLFDIPDGWLYAIAWVESKCNPTARNAGSGALGMFQFIPLSLREWPIAATDVAESCAVTALIARRNMGRLRAEGIDPTLTLTYLCHQQGLTGLLNIYRAASGTEGLGETRLRNMEANYRKDDGFRRLPDQDKAQHFILWWTGRLGQAENEARKTLSR